MTVTQRQIAQQLGVSRESVKAALNGYTNVAVETRQRILEEAQRMGYNGYSNSNARSLVSRRQSRRVRTGIIGLLCPGPDYDFEGGLAPFFLPHYNGVEREALAHGLEVIAFRPQNEVPRLLEQGFVDGLVCLLWNETVQEACRRMPIVALDFTCDAGHSILPDNFRGTQLATRHLFEKGHRRIAYLANTPDFYAGMERLRGYRAGLEESAIGFEPGLCEVGMINLRNVAPTVHNWLGRLRCAQGHAPFTGLVCYNDFIAMQAVRALEDWGLRVPQDVSVVGFDDISPGHRFRPELTSIGFNREEMGRRAARLLMDEIAADQEPTGDSPPFEIETFPVQLIERDSVVSI